MTRYAIIADDLTGAGDSGVHFAAAGKNTALILNHSALPAAFTNHDAVALSTESRFLAPQEAAAAVAHNVTACRNAGANSFYKKIDSTLRGNPGAEIEAALDAASHAAALLCPAMPKTGRTVKDGALLLHNTPIHQSEMGRDPFNPVLTSSIGEIVAAQTALPQARLTLDHIRAGADRLADTVRAHLHHGARILIADARTDDDLDTLGQLLRDFSKDNSFTRLLPVGAGGLAEALVGPARPQTAANPDGRLLAVIGSLTDTTLRQIAHAQERALFFPLDLDMAAAMTDWDSEEKRLLALAATAGDRHLLLKNRTLPPKTSGGISAEDGLRAARIFGLAARALCAAADCRRLYATGGSTAVAVAEAMGLGMVTLRRECGPGVVVSSCECPGLPVRWFITKSGGFGGPETLARLLDPA